MNSLVKTSKLPSAWLKTVSPGITAIRNHWNKDYKPGPYPLTEEDRIAAANKYGIPIEEYEPYPDDGDGSGDYPKMPVISAESKDPFYPWDNPELKRNFNEVLHEDFDYLREDRYDASRKFVHPMWVLWLQFLGVMGGGFLLHKISDKAKMFLAATPPQYPQEGKVHYTFETP